MRSLLHCLRVLVHIDEPATQVTQRELAILLEYARDARIIVEIGTFEGKTAVALARATSGSVYAIDPFLTGRIGISYSRIIAHVARRRSGARNLVFIRDWSTNAAGSFDLPIDLLFIDADHSYEGVKRDWADWVPKVRDGGVVALHDVRIATNSPVRMGSMEFFEREVEPDPAFEEIGAADALVVLRKRPNGAAQ